MKKTLDTSAREDLGDDFKKALDEGWLPIREVARLTGVNAVTLRAWERRYGLIVPQRTPKGHRLFSADHVQRIQAILTWLNRGVAVSQVKELLDTRVRPAVAQDGGDIVYRGYRDGRLYLGMQGACSGCPSSTITLKRGIENLIRHYVPEVESVEAV